MNDEGTPPSPRRRLWLDLGVAAGCGLLTAAALPLVVPLFSRSEVAAGGWLEPLALFAIAPLLGRLGNASPRRAFLLGWLAGLAYFLLALYWLDVAMTTFGRMPRYLSFPVLFLLVGFLALFWGAALWAAVRIRDRLRFGLAWVLPPVWVSFEFLRNYVLTGFPWASLGHTQVRTLWLAQLASLGGVYLVAFAVVYTNTISAAMWAWWRRRGPLPRVPLVGWAILLGFASLYSALRLVGSPVPGDARRFRAAVVQGNLDEKARLRGPGGQRLVLARMLEQSRRAAEDGASLIVWPEGTLPMPVHPSTPALANLEKPVVEAELIVGGTTRDSQEGHSFLTNSAFLCDGSLGIRDRYDKRHLVPFGEYVPLASILPWEWFVPPGVAFFRPGPDHHPVRARAGMLGMLICYEAIFPEIARDSVQRGAEILVNITNDSWYGFSSAPFQHLAISRMRAIETGRYVLRAANTGVSAVIDPRGRELARLPLGLADTEKDFVSFRSLPPADVLVHTVALLGGSTVYVALGDWFAWLCVLVAVGLFAWTFRPGHRVDTGGG